MRKRTFLIYSFVGIWICIMIGSSCKKDENPTTNVGVIFTTQVTDITQSTAKCGGNITSDGGANVLTRGVCWSTNKTPTINNFKTIDGIGTGSFTSKVTGLDANTTYYIRAYATNANGTSYGIVGQFTTLQNTNTAIISTNDINNITQTSAGCGGNITSDGGATVSVRGVCWSTSPTPTITNNKTMDGTGIGSFTSNLTGLAPNTTYYVRAYVTNINGTAYGTVKSFTTLQGNINTVTDIDGNIYHTIIIGTQTWMVENLKTTKYRNGDPIPHVADNTQWNNLTADAYCNYNNDVNNTIAYGRLYNLNAVLDTRNICPLGWHVPSDAEWTTLVTFLGGDNVAGGKLKEIGTTHWLSPNTGATNETGFTALPGGARDYLGAFIEFGNNGHWWSSTKENTTSAWSYRMGNTYPNIGRSSCYEMNGFSVRCIKD